MEKKLTVNEVSVPGNSILEAEENPEPEAINIPKNSSTLNETSNEKHLLVNCIVQKNRRMEVQQRLQ
jgi:hypothetical protein